MMRIVRYYPRAAVGDGGMTKSIRQWSTSMAHAGAEVVIVFRNGSPPGDGDGVIEWTTRPHLGMGRFWMASGLTEILKSGDVLVLHSGWALHNAWAGAVARRLGVPYVLEPRGAYDPHIVRRHRRRKRFWWRAIEGPLVKGADAIHVFFEAEKSHLRALGYDGPFVVVSNGVEAPGTEIWDGGSGGYVLWLGRFDPEHKGLDILLRAMANLNPDERPELRLHGPDWHGCKRDMADMVRELGLGDHVALLPAVYGREKRAVLRRAVGFVYPSRWDACPNSVLEAVSYGVPSLVTPYPLGRFLAERRAAFLAEATPESLAEGLRSLRSPEAAETGRRAARMARDELTWDHSARRWLEQVRPLL